MNRSEKHGSAKTVVTRHLASQPCPAAGQVAIFPAALAKRSRTLSQVENLH